jgi:hypothetical protein
MFATACFGGKGQPTVLSVSSPDGNAVAFVTESQQIDAPHRELWVRFAGSKPQKIEQADAESSPVSRIVWSSDGRAVIFVVSGDRRVGSGVVVRRSGSNGTRPSSQHIELHAASAASISVDSGGRVTFPASDLLPDAPLWLPATAYGDVGIYADGSSDLRLGFSDEVSPESVSESLRARFGQLGWSELSHDVLNPGVPTSFAAGWRVLNGGLIPDGYSVAPTVRGWTGQWRRADVLVQYSLMHVDGRLTGYASYVPPSITVLREKIGQRNARSR